MLSTIVESVALLAIAVGVFLIAGLGWALVVAGASVLGASWLLQRGAR